MRLLIVEDEAAVRQALERALDAEGYDLTLVEDGAAALAAVAAEPPDLILLDVMLPVVDGLETARRLRADGCDVPILMLTARRDESDKVLGLESGADDYLTKPFGVRELVARARALLRRPRGAAEAPAADVVEVGALRLDARRRQAVLDGVPVDLTPHEFDVLFLLASQPGIVFTRERLLERVWTPETHVTERSVDTLIKRLRQKIEADTRDPRLILTVWGTGYKFADG